MFHCLEPFEFYDPITGVIHSLGGKLDELINSKSPKKKIMDKNLDNDTGIKEKQMGGSKVKGNMERKVKGVEKLEEKLNQSRILYAPKQKDNLKISTTGTSIGTLSVNNVSGITY